MYLPPNPLQWSAQFGPSLTNSYDQRQQFDTGTKNPEGPSRLRSPIPPDPGYGTDDRMRSSGRQPLRLRGSDAKAIYKQAIGSAGAPYLLNVRYSNIFQASKTGKLSKNHLNENVKRMRRIMRDTHKRQEVKEQQSQPIPVKALWHSKQYDHVESKVKQKLNEDSHRSHSRPQSAQGNFLRAHENTGPQYLRSQSVCGSRQGSTASLDKLPTTQIDNKTKADFIKINSRYAKTLPKTRKTVSTEVVEEFREKQKKELQSYQEKQNGRIPNYIDKIKEKRDQEVYEARANAPDPDCPPGHVKIDNNQRLTTLKQLQINRSELESKLNHLPIRNDSVILRRTKEDIEKKIIELDEAIKIFSKPKVFIRTDQ